MPKNTPAISSDLDKMVLLSSLRGLGRAPVTAWDGHFKGSFVLPSGHAWTCVTRPFPCPPYPPIMGACPRTLMEKLPLRRRGESRFESGRGHNLLTHHIAFHIVKTPQRDPDRSGTLRRDAAKAPGKPGTLAFIRPCITSPAAHHRSGTRIALLAPLAYPMAGLPRYKCAGRLGYELKQSNRLEVLR